ncbi:MAG TPA: SRPBCC domain-containing protein [Fimbriimonas sp.]
MDHLAFEAFYPHPPERVWRALTDPAEIGKWLMDAVFKPRIGFRYRMEEPSLRIHGTILDVEDGRLLRYTWDDGESGSPSVVTWTLEPKVGGTLVRLAHELPAVEAVANWHFTLDRLGTHLGRPPVPIVYDEAEEAAPMLARAGFRQEETPCP